MKSIQEPVRLSESGAFTSAMKAAQQITFEPKRLEAIEKRLRQTLETSAMPTKTGLVGTLIGALLVVVGGGLWLTQEDKAIVAVEQIQPKESLSLGRTPSASSSTTSSSRSVKSKNVKVEPEVQRPRPRSNAKKERGPVKPTLGAKVGFAAGDSALTGEGTLKTELEMMRAGRRHFEAGNWAEANRLLGNLVHNYPETSFYIEASRLRALALSKQGKHSMAELVIQRLLNADVGPTKRGELLLLLGHERIKLGDCARASLSLENAAKYELSNEQLERMQNALKKCRLSLP